MIIAVDYDNTLMIDKRANIALIRRLKVLQSQGNIIILWTCRNGYRLAEAVRTMARYGFKFNYINYNTPDTIKRLGYDPRKVLADIYIDDKASNIL